MELSEFKANEGKQVNIQVGDRTFARHAIATHFVQVGESYMDLIQKYVSPSTRRGTSCPPARRSSPCARSASCASRT